MGHDRTVPAAARASTASAADVVSSMANRMRAAESARSISIGRPDAGTRKVAKIGRVVRTRSAVAQDRNSGKPLHERGERWPYGLLLSISRFGQQARDRTSVLRYRRVKVSDAVNDVHGRWAEGRRQAYADDAITDQRYERRGAHLPRLPLV